MSGPRPEPARPERRSAYLRGVGGVRIFYRVWEAAEPRGRLLAVHGLGEHSGRFAQAARVLAGRGWSVCALDQRGHGRSWGLRGHAPRLDHLIRDVDRLRRRCGGEGVPIHLLGHSLGGLVVLRHLQEFAPPEVTGAVLLAPFLALGKPVPVWKLRLGRVADRWLPGLTVESEIEREDVVRDPVEQDRLEQDRLVHRRVSARLWGEMQRHAREALERAAEIGVPVLLQIAEDDRVVDAAAARSLADRLPEVEVRSYPGAFHDLLHDPVADEVIRELADWLGRSRRAGRAGAEG